MKNKSHHAFASRAPENQRFSGYQPPSKDGNRYKKIKSYKFGIYAEYLVIIFLILKGYKILRRRHKTYVGEIDIIAKKNDILVAVEVKARKKIEVIEEVLSQHQKKRIKKAIDSFLASSNGKFSKCGIRCDLIVVLPWRVPQHFAGFWE